MSSQIGVLLVESANPAFADLVGLSPPVDDVGSDFGVKMYDAAAPDPVDDPVEPAQWDMQQIRTDEAHAVQAGNRSVDVGVLDSGIDGNHVDFKGLRRHVERRLRAGPQLHRVRPGRPGCRHP